jgi:outer membrane immunogenic protein
MTNRKLILSVALAVGVPFASAGYAATPFVGPYIGGQLGYSVYDIEVSEPGFSSEGLSGSGGEGGLFGGWGMKLTPITYAGVEAEYNWSGAEHLTDGFQIEDKDNYGISARVGWLPANNVMLYGRLGWQRAELEYRLNGFSSKQDHDGLRLGLGAEVAMAGNWLMRLDYAHTIYDDVTVLGTKFEPVNDVFRIGFGFQF